MEGPKQRQRRTVPAPSHWHTFSLPANSTPPPGRTLVFISPARAPGSLDPWRRQGAPSSVGGRCSAPPSNSSNQSWCNPWNAQWDLPHTCEAAAQKTHQVGIWGVGPERDPRSKFWRFVVFELLASILLYLHCLCLSRFQLLSKLVLWFKAQLKDWGSLPFQSLSFVISKSVLWH